MRYRYGAVFFIIWMLSSDLELVSLSSICMTSAGWSCSEGWSVTWATLHRHRVNNWGDIQTTTLNPLSSMINSLVGEFGLPCQVPKSSTDGVCLEFELLNWMLNTITGLCCRLCLGFLTKTIEHHSCVLWWILNWTLMPLNTTSEGWWLVFQSPQRGRKTSQC